MITKDINEPVKCLEYQQNQTILKCCNNGKKLFKTRRNYQEIKFYFLYKILFFFIIETRLFYIFFHLEPAEETTKSTLIFFLTNNLKKKFSTVFLSYTEPVGSASNRYCVQTFDLRIICGDSMYFYCFILYPLCY